MSTLHHQGRYAVVLSAFTRFIVAPEPAWGQLAPNRTQVFGNNRLVTFAYLQNFDCVCQPMMDLDFNGKPAESDPNEMQAPICQPITEPTQDPTGGDIKHTAHLYVLIPMFSVDHDTNPNDAMPCPNGGRTGELCGSALGAALIKLFTPPIFRLSSISTGSILRADPLLPGGGTVRGPKCKVPSESITICGTTGAPARTAGSSCRSLFWLCATAT